MSIRKELLNLHYPRIAAILGVVLYHGSILLEYYGKISWPYYYLKPLYAGVDYLFVLSGFLMYYLYHEYIQSGHGAWQLILKRVLRIYPLYILLTLCLLPAFFLFPQLGVGNERNIVVILKSLVLWPGFYPVLSVGWTLSYQIYFYILFATLFSKQLKTVFFVVMALSLIGFIFGVQTFWFNHYNLEFLLGLLAAFCFFRYRKVQTPLLLALGFCILAIAMYLDTTYERVLLNGKRVLMYGASGFFLLWGLAKIKASASLKLAETLKFLSAASFAVFLSHYPLLALFFRVFFSASNDHFLLKWLMSTLFAIGGGILIHLTVEKLLLARITKHIEMRIMS